MSINAKELNFEILNKDEVLLKINISSDRERITISKIKDYPFLYPLNKDSINIEDVSNFIKKRCFPEERFDSTKVLQALDLDYYSAWNIVKKTHGVLFDDYIWIRFQNENLTWNNVKLRD